MQMLKSKLYELEMRNAWPSSRSWKTPRPTWAGATRSVPMLDQSRIKDLRTNVEISNTQKVLDGDLTRSSRPA